LSLDNPGGGALIARPALRTALDSGRVAHFGADVGWEEPLDGTDPDNRAILGHPRVSITPHIAWYSEHSDRELRRKAANEVARVIRGERPVNVVRHPEP
jgi:D-3-phosphoglycerate dehydrogenase